MSSNCNYYKDIKEILNKRGLDFVYTYADLNPKTVIKSFKSIGRQLYHEEFISETSTKSSLKFYNSYKANTFASRYLYDPSNFRGSQLKFKDRVG